ncbi:MAG: hypothetical protein K8L91_27315 [Anaerolineae bacterium]|nr:hypothetical protein [Anaerolineae bacterium]
MRTRTYTLLVLTILALSGVPLSASHAQTTTFDICVRDFNDANQNGQWEEGEQPFPGIGILVRQDGTVIGALTTTADEDCIRSLPPGVYQLSVEGGGTPYQITTAESMDVTLADQSITVDIGAIVPPNATSVQSGPGNDVCIVVYQDGGQVGVREEGENLVSGVDVNLLASDVVIQTLVTTAEEPKCFSGLPAGEFRIVVPPSPNHLLTTRNDAGVSFLDTGNRITANFGAQMIDPLADGLTRSSVEETEGELTLDQDTRLLFSIAGAAVAMLFMVGTGAIVMSMMRRK